MPRTSLPGPTGKRSEKAAEHRLRKAGLKTVERNYRCRQGEVDLIMRTPDGVLVFVEVRYRANDTRGGALASVDKHKQGRLIQAARHYLATHPAAANAACRFDVVAVQPRTAGEPCIDWIDNAFLAE